MFKQLGLIEEFTQIEETIYEQLHIPKKWLCLSLFLLSLAFSKVFSLKNIQ